ncbi:MAG: L,D-transpeptidase [Anaerolineales bacterium]|nr:L,D-transpeptidase [Anaerolineales bacterium]
MKRTFHAALLLAFILTLAPAPALAAPTDAPVASDPLCLPPTFGAAASDCQQLGSYGYFARLSSLGMTLPLRPLQATVIDPVFADLPISYAIVNTMDSTGIIPRPTFATLDAAVAYTTPRAYIKPGESPHYVTYTSIQQVDGVAYYLTDLGWMRRSDLSPVEVRRFGMGMEFEAQPTRTFGWVLEYAAGEVSPFLAYTSPSLQAPRSSAVYNAYSVIEIFDVQQVADLAWYLVGPDQWLNSLQMRLVTPMTEAPAGVESGRWIEINLEQQSLAVYENNQLIFATLIATGLDNLWTRPGLFQIYEKHETTPMSGDFSGGTGGYYYLADVPWTMYYDQARAIHGAYWRQKQFFGYQGSHGCVNLAIGDARWVYEWANIGDWVYVHDPSGRTPTDDEFQYSEGGA